MPSFERIQTFIHVIEANSYVAAAKKLNLSKAAISKHISSLEQELGVKLIERTTRRLSLTESGSLYYAHCKRLLDLMSEMDELVSTMRQEPTGTLSLFCARYFGEKIVLPHLGEFMTLYPKLKLNLHLEERVPQLDKEDIDIVIGTSIPGPPEAIQRTIAQTRYIFCASPAYLEKFGVPKKPLDLMQHRYITHSMRIPDYVLVFDDQQLHLDPFMRVNDAEAMLQCALKGWGIVKLHDYVVKESIQKGQLIEILASYSQEKFAIYLYYMQNRYLNPKIRHFIDFLLTKLEFFF